MKVIHRQTLPQCDFCNRPAKYDAPTVNGPWANMCEGCSKTRGGNMAIGSRFEQRTPAEPKNDSEIKMAVDISGEEEMYLGDREVECPECSTTRRVEPDAGYVFTCEGCGQRCRCPQIM